MVYNACEPAINYRALQPKCNGISLIALFCFLKRLLNRLNNPFALKKKVSIHDIAKQLNVSAATVSFVLNGKASEKRISEELKKRILKHVEQSGYRPNRLAKSLRT